MEITIVLGLWRPWKSCFFCIIRLLSTTAKQPNTWVHCESKLKVNWSSITGWLHCSVLIARAVLHLKNHNCNCWISSFSKENEAKQPINPSSYPTTIQQIHPPPPNPPFHFHLVCNEKQGDYSSENNSFKYSLEGCLVAGLQFIHKMPASNEELGEAATSKHKSATWWEKNCLDHQQITSILPSHH